MIYICMDSTWGLYIYTFAVQAAVLLQVLVRPGHGGEQMVGAFCLELRI